jgi:hypothetical protein
MQGAQQYAFVTLSESQGGRRAANTLADFASTNAVKMGEASVDVRLGTEGRGSGSITSGWAKSGVDVVSGGGWSSTPSADWQSQKEASDLSKSVLQLQEDMQSTHEWQLEMENSFEQRVQQAIESRIGQIVHNAMQGVMQQLPGMSQQCVAQAMGGFMQAPMMGAMGQSQFMQPQPPAQQQPEDVAPHTPRHRQQASGSHQHSPSPQAHTRSDGREREREQEGDDDREHGGGDLRERISAGGNGYGAYGRGQLAPGQHKPLNGIGSTGSHE